jgi:hypothetical protein
LKKIITAVALLILISPGLCFGAVGTLTISSTEDVVSGGVSKILTIAGVASSTDGTFPALAIDVDSQRIANTLLIEITYDPGNVTVPTATTLKICYTDDYTANGATNCADLLKTAGAALGTTATTIFEPYINSTTLQQGPKYISRNFTLIATQAAVAVNSATVGIKLTFAR